MPVPYNIASIPITRHPSSARNARIRRVSNSFRSPGGGIPHATQDLSSQPVSVSGQNYTLVSPYKTVIYTTVNTDRTLTLPSPAEYDNTVVTVKKIDSGTGFVLIDPGAFSIDGDSGTYDLRNDNEGLAILSYSSDWVILSSTRQLVANPNFATSVSSNHVVIHPEQLVLATTGAGGITVTLPSALHYRGAYLYIKKVDSGAGALTIQRAGADLIDGATSKTISNQWGFLGVMSTGTWNVIGLQDPP